MIPLQAQSPERAGDLMSFTEPGRTHQNEAGTDSVGDHFDRLGQKFQPLVDGRKRQRSALWGRRAQVGAQAGVPRQRAAVLG